MLSETIRLKRRKNGVNSAQMETRPEWRLEAPCSKSQSCISTSLPSSGGLAAGFPLVAYDVIIIGGGAAGLMAAATAGQAGRSVLVIESAERVGKKILISGGGRCNFTNRE